MHKNRLTAPGLERKQKLSLGGFMVKVKEVPNQGLGGSDKARVRAIEFIRSSFDFPNSRL